MAVTRLDDEDWRQRLEDEPLAVVDFYAAWCGNCVIFSRRFAELSVEYPHVRFFVCDDDRAPSMRATVDIDEVPFFGLYRHGRYVGGFSTSDEAAFRERLEDTFGARPHDAPVH